MRATIVRDDNAVTVDGVRISPIEAVSLLADNVHAIQWYGTRGEIEYKYREIDTGDGGKVGYKKPNEAISDFSPYQPLVDTHAQLKAKAEAEAALKAAEAEAAAKAAEAAKTQEAGQ